MGELGRGSDQGNTRRCDRCDGVISVVGSTCAECDTAASAPSADAGSDALPLGGNAAAPWLRPAPAGRRAWASAVDALVLLLALVPLSAGILLSHRSGPGGESLLPRILIGAGAVSALAVTLGLAAQLSRTGRSPGIRMLSLRAVPLGPRASISALRAVARCILQVPSAPALLLGALILPGSTRMGGLDRILGLRLLDVAWGEDPGQPAPIRERGERNVIRRVRMTRSRALSLPARLSRPAHPSSRGLLRFDDGTAVELSGAVVLGRAPVAGPGEQGLRIDDPFRSLSRSHLHVRLGMRSCALTDLGSRNGTRARVAGGSAHRLTPHQTVHVPYGTRVMLADRSLLIEECRS